MTSELVVIGDCMPEILLTLATAMGINDINPADFMDYIARYGADAVRWFMLSDSPPERDVIWTEEGVQGAGRFVKRRQFGR